MNALKISAFLIGFLFTLSAQSESKKATDYVIKNVKETTLSDRKIQTGSVCIEGKLFAIAGSYNTITMVQILTDDKKNTSPSDAYLVPIKC